MDGLDLEAARGFEGAGEKLAGTLQHGAIGRCDPEFGQQLGQLRIADDDPGAQALEQPVGHFGSRRLGEGQAHDARRIGAAKHQADDAINQHMGLARAGIGIDPDGGLGIGRLQLFEVGLGVEIHGPSPDSAHSRKRER